MVIWLTFMSVETTLKFYRAWNMYMMNLSPEDKEAYEDTFEDENGEMPDSIGSAALNEWLFNEDTIKKVLHILMTNGLKIDYGNKMERPLFLRKITDHCMRKIILRCSEKELSTSDRIMPW